MDAKSVFRRLAALITFCLMPACGNSPADQGHIAVGQDDLKIDPATGVPYAYIFQFPIMGFDTSDFGFGFASRNDRFCLESSNGQCTAYGYHLGRDTVVGKTPVGTEVVAPADGIVRLTTDVKYGGYGSDSKANPQYKGCLVVLEHEFPNSQPVTTLLGHLKCESGSVYDENLRTGNPPAGTIVRRGQHVGHVAHYWSGNGQSADWHHLHWGMRKGAFQNASVAEQVRGYAKKSDFTIDSVIGVWAHPDWIDPFLIVAANGDPALAASAETRHHPSGTLLEDSTGQYWLVKSEQEIANVPSSVMAADRFDPSRAVRVTDEELNCYSQASPLSSQGPVTLYQRPNSSTVIMAYDGLGVRYDVIRWEALLSWGYDDSDLTTNQAAINLREQSYAPAGYRLLRPGTLVKADEESEVAIVTWQQTRLPIASAAVFEAMGFAWERVVSVPKVVLTDVAGPRENNKLADLTYIHSCTVQQPCPGGGSCGGGGDPPEQDAGSGNQPSQEACNGQDDDGNGQIDEIFLCKFGSLGNVCITSCNTAGTQLCTAPACSWGACLPFPEACDNTIDDDCNGLVDCADPACASNPNCQQQAQNNSPVHVSYAGPSSPGYVSLAAWWQPPNALPRLWGTVNECADLAANDGQLDCWFSLPAGTSPFEFQIYLPDGRFWGDKSCSLQGGCGQAVGNVSITGPNGSLPIEFTPNNQNNLPYYNGRITMIP